MQAAHLHPDALHGLLRGFERVTRSSAEARLAGLGLGRWRRGNEGLDVDSAGRDRGGRLNVLARRGVILDHCRWLIGRMVLSFALRALSHEVPEVRVSHEVLEDPDAGDSRRHFARYAREGEREFARSSQQFPSKFLPAPCSDLQTIEEAVPKFPGLWKSR